MSTNLKLWWRVFVVQGVPHAHFAQFTTTLGNKTCTAPSPHGSSHDFAQRLGHFKRNTRKLHCFEFTGTEFLEVEGATQDQPLKHAWAGAAKPGAATTEMLFLNPSIATDLPWCGRDRLQQQNPPAHGDCTEPAWK